ncbi:MAG: L-seryl-tRNA(Sec) selenium transferase [Thermoanaerobaculia bacterium]|nr:L-seryl-tRNA(Sec) selenium transferase [Thermoanaerobaculia bacterium]
MNQLLNEPRLRGVVGLYGRDSVRVQATRLLDSLRRELANGALDAPDLAVRLQALPEAIATEVVRAEGTGLQRVINATGIFIHTNLGRAPLPRDVAQELVPLLTGSCDLEMDLGTGRRSDRNRFVAERLESWCGAEKALVVNNNAGALVLVLAELARNREVVVSRGELVEIGGAFRIPDILEAAGARLVEVGTTNRTRIGDYRRALSDETALLLKVHTSNYRIRGFTESVSSTELAELGRSQGIPVLVDEGSGLLRSSSLPPLREHEDLRSLLAAGCDLVCGSGDKLLGGPQAGLLLGRADLVERCRRNPLYRALRPSRFAFAALEWTLRRLAAGAELSMARLWPDETSHSERLERCVEALRREQVDASIAPSDAFVGGGSAPDEPIPGLALAIEGRDDLLAGLRVGGIVDNTVLPPVVGYLKDKQLVLDLRTVDPDEDLLLVRAVAAAHGRTNEQSLESTSTR